MKNYSYRQVKERALAVYGAVNAQDPCTHPGFGDSSADCLGSASCACADCTSIQSHGAYIRAMAAIRSSNISPTEFQEKYLNVREAILGTLRERGTDRFWVEWVEGILQIQPSSEGMARADFHSEIICYPNELLQGELRDVVSTYFALFHAVSWPIGFDR